MLPATSRTPPLSAWLTAIASNLTVCGFRIIRPRCSATCVIGVLHTFLRLGYPNIKRITSYSDTGEGNYGTVDRAANYRLEGETDGTAFYRLPDGEKVHRVSLWHRHGKEGNRWEWLQERYPGIEHLAAPQLRFV